MKFKHVPKFFKKAHTLFWVGGFGCAGASLLHGKSGLLSCYDGRGSVVKARGLRHCGSWTLEHRLKSCGSGLVALWHVDQRLNTCLPHWQASSLH